MFLVASDDSRGTADEELSNSFVQKEDGLVTAFTLRDNDVLFGRGSGPNGFAGNVRYRNLIRSILIKACHIHDDASIDSDLDFYVPDNCKDQDVTISRRNRILAIQVVKAIKSRKGRFLQRCTTVSNHIERIMYKEVEESIAIEKTKQNFRDQLRQLQMEQRGGGKIITAPAGTRLSHEEDCWTLRSMNPIITPGFTADGKRKRTNDDFSVSGAGSLNVSNKVFKRFSPGTVTSSQDVRKEIQMDDVLAMGNCLPLPKTAVNSFNDLLVTRSLPSDSFLHSDDMMMDRVLLSRHAVPLSQIGDPRGDQRLSYRHRPTTSTTKPRIMPKGVGQIVYENSRPRSLLEDHLRMKSCKMTLDPQAAIVGKGGRRPNTNIELTLGGRILRGGDDTSLYHHSLASSPRPTILPSLLATRSLPFDSFLHSDDMMMDKVLSSRNAVPLSQIGDDPRWGQQLAYRHRLTTSTTEPFIMPNGVGPIVYKNSRPQSLLEDHLRMQSCNMALDPQAAFVGKRGLRSNTNVVERTLGDRIRDPGDMCSHHRLVASPPSIKNRPLPSSMSVSAGANTTTERVEAMIASHQTRRDRFWMGWAKASNC